MIFRFPGRSGEGPFVWLATLLGAGHLAFVVLTGTTRVEHVLANVLLVLLAWVGPRSRAFVKGALPLWLTGVMLDNQRFWLHLRGPIHTGDLWEWERSWFPAPPGGVASTWPEYFDQNTNVILDVLCGFGYATYLVQFFGLMIALFFLKDSRFGQMAWAFFVVNALGCLTYVLYPAAPPWYVMAHGMGPADLAALPSAAGAARFDALFGIRFFENFYARNPNVFGAMPSLHTAYPVVALWMVWHRGIRWRAFAAGFASLIAFSAVYLSHHYILDVLGGVAVALVAAGLVQAVSAVWVASPARAALAPAAKGDGLA
jgi:inositol phosphorylceramide synthase catalytic subunit